MRTRILLLPLLAALAGCLDPLVGEECAEGYMMCGGRCVSVPLCLLTDGGRDSRTVGPDGLPDGGGAETGDIVAEDAGNEDADESPDAFDDDVPADDAPADADDPGVPDAPSPDVPVPSPDTLASARDTGVDVPVDAPRYPPDVPRLVDLAIDLGADTAVDAVADVLDALPDVPESPDVPIVDDAGGVGGDAGGDDGGGATDALYTPADTGPDGPPICLGNTILCSGECVDPFSDPRHCGECGNPCASNVCLNGICLTCSGEESVCGDFCTDLMTDPDNCGQCGLPCANGLCSNGHCEAQGTGRVVVIGHDYLYRRPAMYRILGNAVFLWPTNPVRVLAYYGQGNATAIAGANFVIDKVAADSGRTYSPMVVSPSDVPTRLPNTDVFLIYAQEFATNEDLQALGLSWKSALTTFVNNGGTVILLDAVHAGNNGTVQILEQADLFHATSRAVATEQVCSLVSLGDALAIGVGRSYLCERNTVAYTTTEVNKVVQASGGGAVVVHKVF